MKRRTESILGLAGGVLGILLAFFILLIGLIDGTGAALQYEEGVKTTTTINRPTLLGIGVFIASMLGIAGSVVVEKSAKIGGIIMLVAAILGGLCVSILYIISGILLLTSGLMSIFRNEKKPTTL